MLKDTLNKGISTPIAIGIVLILAIIVGGFTWWQYSEIKKEEAQLPEMELIKEEGVEWKTYISKRQEFEIKYPSDWEVEEIKDEYTIFNVGFKSPKEDRYDLVRENISIFVRSLWPDDATIEKFKGNFSHEIEYWFIQEGEITNIDDDVIDERPAFRASYSNKALIPTIGKHNLKQITIGTPRDEKAYFITYTAEPDKFSDYLEVAEKIIDSFKFIEFTPQSVENCGEVDFHDMWSCYRELAKNERDCEKIEHSDIRDECYRKFAESSESCEKIEGQSDRNTCYVRLATDSKDLSICEKVKRYDYSDRYEGINVKPHEREHCYWKVAEAKGDSSICDKIEPLLYKNVCYLHFAYNLKDSSMCENVENTANYVNEKKKCYHLATVHNEPPLLKTYKNETYNYQLDYPEDDLIYETEDKKIVFFESIEEIITEKTIPLTINLYTGVQSDGYTFDKSAFGISNWRGIAIEETELSESLEEWLKDGWKLEERFGLKEFKVGRINHTTEIVEIIIRDNFKGYWLGECGHDCISSGYYLRYGNMVIRAELGKETLSTFKTLD